MPFFHQSLRASVLALTVVGAAACASTDAHDAQAEQSAGSPALEQATGIAAKDGFAVRTGDDGRPWVFVAGSEDLAAFDAGTEPGQNVTIFVDGVGVRSTEKATVHAWAATREGFVVRPGEGGFLWVFDAGSDELASFEDGVEPAQNATLFIGGKPFRSTDLTVLERYAAARPGFVARRGDDGYTWIFRSGSDALAAFDRGEESAKNATLFIGGKPYRSVALEILQAYQSAVPGFVIRQGEDGYSWVFRAGSEGLAAFDRGEEPAKSATLFIGGKPYRSLELADLRAYAAARN